MGDAGASGASCPRVINHYCKLVDNKTPTCLVSAYAAWAAPRFLRRSPSRDRARDRTTWIFRGDADRRLFLNRLADWVIDSRAGLYAWALMPNHAHLLLRTGQLLLSHLMQAWLSAYSTMVNRRHRRSGHPRRTCIRRAAHKESGTQIESEMSPYILAPLAREDLRKIWDRIAEDDFDTADRVLEEIRSAISNLTRRPPMGHVRRDLAPPEYRFWPGSSATTSSRSLPAAPLPKSSTPLAMGRTVSPSPRALPSTAPTTFTLPGAATTSSRSPRALIAPRSRKPSMSVGATRRMSEARLEHFDSLWEHIGSTYAGFATLPSLDWNEVRDTYRPKFESAESYGRFGHLHDRADAPGQKRDTH
jgi:plasmid stabilization system protein ParE/REP element-mobilizing transposase RayT